MPNISKRFTPDTSVSGAGIATAASSLKNPVDRKIYRRWVKRWEPMLRFRQLSEAWLEKFRVEHSEAMKAMLRRGLEMRAIVKNDFDDLGLTEAEREELLSQYRWSRTWKQIGAGKTRKSRHEALDGLRD